METYEIKTNNMTRYQPLTLYGIIIALKGIIIASLAYNPSRVIQYIVAAGLFLSAIFAFIASYKNRHQIIPVQYHALQGLGLIVFAIAIVIYAHTLERFIYVTTYFLLYFGISEIIIGFRLLISPQKANFQLILFRAIIGLLTTLGAILVLTTSYINPNIALLGSGIAFIFGGAGFILFAKILKNLSET